MRSRRVLSALLGILCISLGAWLVGPAVQAQMSTQGYLETFEGTPAAPVPYGPPGWDVQIHSRDTATWASLEPMVAQHGPACQGPPATHSLTGDYPSSVFNCANHIMTSIKAGGYGVIYLTPPALADFSAGEAVIRWDMSTFRTSMRDWVDVWISPVEDHKALPLGPLYPDLSGPPRNAINAVMTQGGVNGGLWSTLGSVTQYKGYANVTPNGYMPSANSAGYETVLVPDKARRDTFEIHVSPTHFKVGMPAYNLWWVDAAIEPPLSWNQAVVQFGHHSYTPQKDSAACD